MLHGQPGEHERVARHAAYDACGIGGALVEQPGDRRDLPAGDLRRRDRSHPAAHRASTKASRGWRPDVGVAPWPTGSNMRSIVGIPTCHPHHRGPSRKPPHKALLWFFIMQSIGRSAAPSAAMSTSFVASNLMCVADGPPASPDPLRPTVRLLASAPCRGPHSPGSFATLAPARTERALRSPVRVAATASGPWTV